MSIRPCDSRVDCSGSDFPLRNLSSEGPDLPQYSATGFCCNGAQAWAFSLVSQENADDALFRLLKTSCPECTEARQYCAEAKCPDGTVLAKYCSPISQEVVDEWARQREALMLPFCDDTAQLFSATCACPDGSNPITMFSPFSVDDALAACQSSRPECPPVGNDEQVCAARCPDGSLFYWVVAAGTILATTVAEANAIAYALACERAELFKVCISGPDPSACLNVAYSSVVTASTATQITWQVLGSLPPGLTGAPVGLNGYRIQGIPTTSGIYTLTFVATNTIGNYAVKTVSIRVWGIQQTALPDGTFSDLYSQQLTSIGGTAPYVYSVVSGFLPLGITMTSAGLISGIVGEIGVFTPEIRVIDHQGRICTQTFTLTCVSGCPTMPIVGYTLPAVPGYDTGPWDNYKAWWIEYPSLAKLDTGDRVLVCGRNWLSPYRPHGLTLYDFSTNPATLVQYIDGPGLYNNVMSQFMVCPDNRKIVGLINHKNSSSGAITYEYFFLVQATLGLTYLTEIVPLTYYMPVYLRGTTNHIAFCKGAGASNLIDVIDCAAETLEQIPGPAVDLRIYYGASYCCEENVFLFSGAAGLTKVSRSTGLITDVFPVSGDRMTYSNVQNEIWMFDQTNAYVYSMSGTLLATLPYTETLYLTGNVKAVYNEKLNCAAIVGYETGTGDFVHVAYVYDCASRTLKQKITLATYPLLGYRPREIVPDAFTSGYMYTVDEIGIWREIIPTII